jgi:hypothetical protein
MPGAGAARIPDVVRYNLKCAGAGAAKRGDEGLFLKAAYIWQMAI